MPLDDLNEGITPGHSTIYGSYGSSDYNSMQYREDIKKFRKIALESVEHGSSDCSELTSDYGQNPSSSSTEDRQTAQEIEPQKAEKVTNITIQSSSTEDLQHTQPRKADKDTNITSQSS